MNEPIRNGIHPEAPFDGAETETEDRLVPFGSRLALRIPVREPPSAPLPRLSDKAALIRPSVELTECDKAGGDVVPRNRMSIHGDMDKIRSSYAE